MDKIPTECEFFTLCGLLFIPNTNWEHDQFYFKFMSMIEWEEKGHELMTHPLIVIKRLQGKVTFGRKDERSPSFKRDLYRNEIYIQIWV